jgi:cytochrome c551/c552
MSKAAAEVFDKLEANPMFFTITETNRSASMTKGYGGTSGWSYDAATIGPAWKDLSTLFPGQSGISIVNSAVARGDGKDPGEVAWHEAVHLTGVVDHGHLYPDGDPIFNGVPGGTGSHTMPPEDSSQP